MHFDRSDPKMSADLGMPPRAPFHPDSTGPAYDRLDVTWTRALKVWWSLAWRGILFGTLAGALAGACIGIVGASAGADQPTIQKLGSLAGLAVGLPVGLWVVRTILQKSWSDFRIVLVPRDE
jgi:hypothetical protein